MISSSIRIRISPSAAQEIIEQAHYYQAKADNTLASKWREAVKESIFSLRPLPERGTSCNFKATEISGLRCIGIRGFPKHLIFYQSSESSLACCMARATSNPYCRFLTKQVPSSRPYGMTCALCEARPYSFTH